MSTDVRAGKQQISKTQLRKFGWTLAVGLAVIGLISLFRGHDPKLLWIMAGALFVLGIVSPRFLLPLRRVWMSLAVALAWLNTRIILTLLFYVVFAPVGIVIRLFRDPLNRQLRDGSSTCWIPREPKSGNYENQF